MTFKEAEERLAAMPELGYRTVEFESRFHTTGNTNRVCKLYTEAHGGVCIDACSWEQAFDLLKYEIQKRSLAAAGLDQAPLADILPPPGKEADDDIPF
jgi:hypothetical protein